MPRYHINKKGDPGVCKAEKGACPFGGQESHYDSKEAAYKSLENSFITVPKYIKLDTNLGTFNVALGDLSDIKARLALSSGLCGDLAYEIHKKTGLRPAFVFYQEMTEEELLKKFTEDPKYIHNAQHVMVESSDGEAFIDAYGYKTEEEVDDFYEGITIIKGTPAMIEAYASDKSSRLTTFADAAIELDSKKEGFEYEMDFY